MGVIVTREQIMENLLAQIRRSCGTTFAFYSRKFIMYLDLVQLLKTPKPDNDPRNTIRSPALFLYDGPGFGGGRTIWVQGARGQPAKRTMHVTIVIYAWRDNTIPGGGQTPYGASDAAGTITLYPLIEAVEAALDPEPNLPGYDLVAGSLTFGGLVTYAWIAGEGHTIPGDLDPSGIAMQTIPLQILIP